MAFKFKPNEQNPSLDDVAEQLKKARAAATIESTTEAIQETPKAVEEKKSTKPLEYVKPKECTERIRIVFDDSGSMAGQAIAEAIAGVTEFMRNCVPNQTAVAIHPMDNSDLPMSTNLPSLAKGVKNIDATGSYTPLFATWQKAQRLQPSATRFVIFSDGAPDGSDLQYKEAAITNSIQNKISCDTILISQHATESDKAYRLLKEIADRTGGIFMVFDRNKMDFRTGFKYLTPVNRLALNAPGMKEALQEGRLK